MPGPSGFALQEIWSVKRPMNGNADGCARSAVLEQHAGRQSDTLDLMLSLAHGTGVEETADFGR